MKDDPLSEAPLDAMSGAEQRQRARKHIMCVNGSAAFLDVLRELFEQEHFNVTTTNFVPRTFDQVAALQPDLLIIDLIVAEQSGWELLEHLQREALTNAIPVIVTSTDRRLLERAQTQQARYGGTHFLVKPLDIEALLATVDAVIGKA